LSFFRNYFAKISDFIHRKKRDLYDTDGDRPYDLYYDERDRRSDDRRFDPFLFGSSDRFSHGFGKRVGPNGAPMASV